MSVPTDSRDPAAAAPAAIPFATALRFWAWLGCVSFGGPAGQIALMHTELVERRRWVSERRFLHALDFCMVLPGPEAQQLATYLGWLMHRTWGGVVAGVLFVLPSAMLLIAMSWAYLAFGHTPWVGGAFHGIKPAVTAIVLHALWRIGSRTLRHPAKGAIAVVAFVALAVLHVPFPLLVVAAAIVGAVGTRVAPQVFAPTRAPVATPATASVHAAVIDDATPPPAHARFSGSGFARVVAIGVALWAVPMATLWVACGPDHPFTRMALFFTQAALVTFGGAYAVLPYVWQGAVVEQRWLGPAQMVDGLALGETTPGPLIMVVMFVAFVGGWNTAPFGADHTAAAGAVAAALVTWFTFLPSFVFVLAGGPIVEGTRDTRKFAGPLAAITAAVVGVIANLAVFFAVHTLWPHGADGPFDAFALVVACVAAAMLFVLKRGAIAVIAVCAAAGLAWEWLRP